MIAHCRRGEEKIREPWIDCYKVGMLLDEDRKIASFWTVKDVHMNLNSSVDKILRRESIRQAIGSEIRGVDCHMFRGTSMLVILRASALTRSVI